MTSSVAPSSNSSLTWHSSGSPSTSTSVSGAFNMFSVTSADFPIRPWFPDVDCCFTTCCCWTNVDCCACWGIICCCLTVIPASSNVFFFKVVRIWELEKKTIRSVWDSDWLPWWQPVKTYTVRLLMCSLILLNSSLKALTDWRSISISSSAHLLHIEGYRKLWKEHGAYYNYIQNDTPVAYTANLRNKKSNFVTITIIHFLLGVLIVMSRHRLSCFVLHKSNVERFSFFQMKWIQYTTRESSYTNISMIIMLEL